MSKTKLAVSGLMQLIDLCSTDKVQKMLFGTYSNGKARSMVDAINDEVLSPKQRKSKLYKKRKSGKKKIRL
jgi:hypothetical protein